MTTGDTSCKDTTTAEVYLTDEAFEQFRELPKVLRPRVTRITEPSIPEPDERGLRPAIPAMRAVIARDIIQDRLAAGITQRELARRAGVRPETLSRIEAGKHTPTETTVARIYRALGQATETTTSDETASKRKAKRDGKRPTQLKRAKVGQ